ncbi:MAG: thiamine pyrophosphate-binding protein [Gemmatimonadetes bacterium]|nr:thiamine pyrophosphate-binding protein [Gemmatimonadota bacterium]
MSTTKEAYYSHFERHSHGEGLKGGSTHYCPGCGHGLIHNYIVSAVSELGIQDRTIAISPVGCSVFMYYYLDVGNTQAAHGRAPAVGLGHKLANPESVVLSYQGDGDLASIGLAEIMFTVQLGVPFTVIFVNNAIYGMTGGQMAPTTLMGQRSTTSPTGRGGILQGQPMKVAEMMAQLDGSVYVERVALYDNKQRKRAGKAVHKALRIQAENRGLAFVEILAECPTHLKMNALDTQEWVKEEMTKIYPLGVLKDEKAEPMEPSAWPSYDPHAVLAEIGATNEAAERHAAGFPAHIDRSDVAMKLAGSGGDGAQTAAMLITHAAINEGFDATHIPSYGPESRGGTSYADVHLAVDEVLSPASPNPHVLVAFNAPSLQKFAPSVVEGGVVIYDSSVVVEAPDVASGVRLFPVPCTEIAIELGSAVVKNTVALGATLAATRILPDESILDAIRAGLGSKQHLLQLNEDALKRGGDAVRAQLAGPSADGVVPANGKP